MMTLIVMWQLLFVPADLQACSDLLTDPAQGDGESDAAGGRLEQTCRVCQPLLTDCPELNRCEAVTEATFITCYRRRLARVGVDYSALLSGAPRWSAVAELLCADLPAGLAPIEEGPLEVRMALARERVRSGLLTPEQTFRLNVCQLLAIRTLLSGG